MEFEDAQYLFNELLSSSNSKNRLWVESTSCGLDFYLDEESNLRVEICFSRNELWAISEIYLTVGKEMLKIAYEEKDFEEIMPTTDRNWDTYSSLKN